MAGSPTTHPLERIISVVASLPGVSGGPVTPDMHLGDDLGIDSLGYAELMNILVEELGISKSGDELLQTTWESLTVADLHRWCGGEAKPPSASTATAVRAIRPGE